MSTRPQPFKLSTSKSAAQIEKYQSAAEKIAAFHKQTPERFRTHPRGKYNFNILSCLLYFMNNQSEKNYV